MKIEIIELQKTKRFESLPICTVFIADALNCVYIKMDDSPGNNTLVLGELRTCHWEPHAEVKQVLVESIKVNIK